MIRISATTWWARGTTLALAFLIAAALAFMLAVGLAHAAPTTFTVNSTSDLGTGVCDATECTLREAMTDANTNAGADTIEFDIPAADLDCVATTGVCTISPTSALPDITQAVTIDGYSQPGASPNTLATGNNAALKIELSGTNAGAGANGIEITGPNSVVKGLVINSWRSDGVEVSGAGAGGNRIEGNFIGTDANGTVDLGNDFGVIVEGAPNNVVGGTSTGARNLISGNGRCGIYFETTAGATGNRIEGNFIGTNAAGSASLGNGFSGVCLNNGQNNVVGGTSAGSRNLISGNEESGVALVNSSTTGNRILRNSIFDNGELGIDFNSGTATQGIVTANDAGDADTGPNNLQNYPVLTSATTSGGETTIQGFLNSTANNTFDIQFFRSPAADSSGFGEGETYVGQTNVTTNASGDIVFSVTTATPLAGEQDLSATATKIVTGDTSEFSGAVEVEANTPPPPPPPPGCTIGGTSGDDTLSGTSGSDTICGLGGDDTIDSGSGNDTVRGGEGNDTIAGDSGSDTLEGEGGNDTVRGGAGNDNLSGGAGKDRLHGEAGNDALNSRDGMKGNDLANGGTGTDTCAKDKKDRNVNCP